MTPTATGAVWLRVRPGEIEALAVRDGELAEYGLWRPGAPDGFGDLHRGRVGARSRALGGVFVRLEGEPDGFLPDREVEGEPGVGALLAVRIVRASLGGKGPKLSARLDEADRAAAGAGDARRIGRGASVVADVLGACPDLPVLVRSRAEAARVAAAVCERPVLVAAEGPGEAIAEAAAGLREAAVSLPCGARATITPTPALVAIDVDGGGGGDGRAGAQAAQLALNRALVPALMRQVRLRNLSGAIMVDLAGLGARKRALLAPDIEAALRTDRLAPRLLGFTALGLAEIVRVRQRPALHELLTGAHAAALLAAAALERALVETPHRALAVRASPAVARALAADEAIGADLLRGSGRRLAVRSDPVLEGWRWELVEPER